MKRVWKCPECKRTFDLAREVPKLQAGKGRLLTDEEVNQVVAGSFHTCPGPDSGIDFIEAEDRPAMALTDYDYLTGKPR